MVIEPFIYGGNTNSTAFRVYDSVNTITFALFPAETLALTATYVDSSGKVLDSDIRFNTWYQWSPSATDNNSYGKYPIDRVAMHELGHGLGLGDLYPPYSPDIIMYQWVSNTIRRPNVLSQDDINGFLYIYNSGDKALPVIIQNYLLSDL